MKNQILRKTWEFWDSNLEKTSESITQCSMPRERPHIANCAKGLSVMMHFPRSLYRVVVLVRHGKEKQISVTIGVNIHLWLLELSDIGYKSSLKNWIVGFFLHFCIFELLHTDSLSVVWIFWGQLWPPIYFWGSFAFSCLKSAEICSSVLKQTRPKTLLTVIEVLQSSWKFFIGLWQLSFVYRVCRRDDWQQVRLEFFEKIYETII